ncbi:GNAT family N-acetyltransferase [Lysobacter solisilvae (ex Woo and Kim 2020)]|uniref:GNAT family N-acetyltransferase n=1 Tax=Agrilutibacter terrestris TaxID=2865112 RepID=A0A7H0FZI4_9GAMM|nr:GNAT family N-acetyltransferase [Lysobacter terrestris]QNP41450.1 GNAT family N-acetyltransferase [Lysobacter terrestris]
MGRLAGSSTGTLRIRPAQIGDANDVAVLLEELGYPCTRDDAAERIARVLHDPRLFLLVAEIEGAVCGLMSLDIRYSITRGADLARITALVVAANCGRQGIGRQLLREAEAIARRAQVARIEVTSNQRREAAHAFYLGCGYSEGSRHFIKLLGD